MAEIRDQYVLDLVQALHQIDTLENEAKTSLHSIPVDLDLTHAQQQLSSLTMDIDTSDASRLNSELAGVERHLNEAEQEADQLTGSVRNVARATRDADQDADKLAASFARVKGQLVTAAAGFGLFQAIRGAVGFAVEAKNAFAVLQDSTNAVKVVFGEASKAVLDYSENVASVAGLSSAEFQVAATTLGSALINVGFAADEAAKKTVELTQRAADMASLFGGDVNVALQAILSALRGEGNPIERFGVTLTETRVQAEAAALGFQSLGGEFDPMAKAAARLNIIMRETARTAGDFANTSDDLANKQKATAAAFEETKAQLGEALAPLFQSLLDTAPAVTEALIDLVPAVNAFAESLAGAIENTPGALDLVDALNLIADLPRGFGEVFNSLKGISNLAATVGESFVSIFTAPFTDTSVGDTWRAGMTRNAALVQESLERVSTQGLINDLREGADKATTLANRLADVGRRSKLDPKFITDLGKIAGVDLQTQLVVIRSLIDESERLGLEADDIAALSQAYALVNDQLDGMDIDALHELNRVSRELAEEDHFSTVTTRFTTFATDTKVATEAAAAALVALSEASEAQAARTADAFNLFDELPDKIKGSFANAVEALREQTEAIAAFEINLAILEALGLDALAADFKDKGIAAADQLAQALNDIPLAIEADQILQGVGIIGEEAFEALVDRFVSVGMKPEDARRLAESLKIASPQVLAAAQEAGKEVGTRQAIGTVSSYREALIAEGRAMDLAIVEGLINERVSESFDAGDQAEFAAGETADRYIAGLIAGDIDARVDAIFEKLSIGVDFFSDGAEARQTFLDGLSTAQANEEQRLRDSIEGVLNNAIQKRSPPKLFLDAGAESNEAFWMGFEKHDPSFKMALPPVVGSAPGVAPAAVPGAAAPGGGFTFAPTYVNTETKELETVVARSEQLLGSVAGILNGNFKL